MAFKLGLRARRRALFATALSCVALALQGFSPAAALDLDEALKPVDAAAEKVRNATSSATLDETVGETVNSVLDPVEEVTKPAADAIDPVLDPVRDAVDDTTKPVTDVIDDLTDPVRDPVDPREPVSGSSGGGASADGGTDGPRDEGQGDGSGPGPGRDEPQHNDARRSGATSPGRLPVTGDTTTVRQPAPALRAAAGDGTPTAVGSPAEQVSRAVTDASRAFRFPLLLAAALLLFLALHTRLDSRDPRLSQPEDDQELMFA